jgi:hypothetical protein
MASGTFVNTGMGSPMSRNAMKGANAENFNVIINGRSLRPPLRTIHIFSVAKRAFSVRHPLFPKLTLKGCEPNERWTQCTTVPDPIPQACPDQERGGTRTDDNDGWISAIDMLNPGNFTLDPYTGSENPNFYANANGMNLISEGVWPSFNETPTEEEIKRAEKCRDSHYRYLTREALRLAAVSTRELNEFLQQYPDTHIAMDMQGLEASWHQRNEVKATCPNCGDSVKQGLAFHQSSAGILCIIDPQRAWKAGAITRERFEELTPEDDDQKAPHGGPRIGRAAREERMRKEQGL